MTSSTEFSISSFIHDNKNPIIHIELLKTESNSSKYKYSAVKTTNIRYNQKINDLEFKIRDINDKSKLSISYMDKKCQNLSQEFNKMQILLGNLPEESEIERQIYLIQSYMNKKPQLVSRKISDAVYFEKGLIGPKSSPYKVERLEQSQPQVVDIKYKRDRNEIRENIQRLLLLRKTHYEGQFNFDIVSKTTEEASADDIKMLIKRMGVSMKKMAKSFVKESSKLEKEIIELKKQRKKLRAEMLE